MPAPVDRDAGIEGTVLSAGTEKAIARDHHTPTSLGPGVKPRDDSGARGKTSNEASAYPHKPYSHSIVPGGFDVTS